MVFEKKVIVGSIMSFIATAIGIIAVFFPDLLNLQKEKVASFSASISNKQEAQKFVNFLDEMVKEKKIFKLDVLICFPNGDRYYVLDNFLVAENLNENKISKILLQALTPFDSITPKELKEIYNDIPTEGYRGDILGSKNYYFDNISSKNAEWIAHWRRAEYLGKVDICNFSEEEGLNISGYFLVSKSGNFKAAIENTFEKVSEQQLKLKNY